MAKISVIVPVYKVKEYINRCIDSILNQTFYDLEVILVDDGSPDECGQICEEYAEKDSRVKSVHKENGGLSDARNYGYSYATGEYVIFIDSDDYVESDMLQYMYDNIEKYQADMSTCGAYDVFGDRLESKAVIPELVCTGEEAFEYILKGVHIRGEIWNKLIKRQLIENIRFPKGKLYEDIFFTAQMMQKIKKVCVGTKPKYYYVHRSESITGKPYRPQLQDIIEAYEYNYSVVCKEFKNLQEIAECLKIWSRFIVLDKLLLEMNYRQHREYKTFRLYLVRHMVKILKNHYFSLFRKISIIVLSVSLGLYRKMVFFSIRKQTTIKG